MAKYVWVLISLIAFVGCSDPKTNVNPNDIIPIPRPDVDDEDSDEKGDDAEEDTNQGEEKDIKDEQDTDPGPDPGKRACPTTIQDSCIAPALECMGDARQPIQCLSFGEEGAPGYREQVQFSNGAYIHYDVMVEDGEERELRVAYGPDGERCYFATALEAGKTPSRWRVSEPRFGSFVLETEGGITEIGCGGAPTEICSQERLKNAFAMPWERARSCTPYRPDDLCALDSECGEGQACCQHSEESIRQCLPLDFCVNAREPVPCEDTSDCAGGYMCSRCTRSGIRECVPAEIAEDPNNTLGCIEDYCQPGGDQCSGGQTCCEVGDVFQCILPHECTSAPDPNPVCDPSAAQPCAAAVQQCCFVEQSLEFRCLANVGYCRTDVCFIDEDCPTGESCCGGDLGAGVAGSCGDTCEPPDLSCDQDSDCLGDWLCCKYPGYERGLCLGNAMDCGRQNDFCERDIECGAENSICCTEAPLTEGVCIELDFNTCPPPMP